MCVILAAESLAGAGHENKGGGVGGSEKTGHADAGFFEGGEMGDLEDLVLVIDDVAGLNGGKIMKNCAGVTDEEGLVGVLLVGASDVIGGGEGASGGFKGGDWSGEGDAGDGELGGDGFDSGGGLEAKKDIERKGD